MSFHTAAIAPLAHLRRPRLLISAARFGLSSYDRTTALPQLVRGPLPRAGQPTLDLLSRLEAEMNDARRVGAAGYTVAKHVQLLCALMAEASVVQSGTLRAVN